MKFIFVLCIFFGLIALESCGNKSTDNECKQKKSLEMETTSKIPLGAFSLSLSVKDLNVSKAFYENLGFKQLGGDIESNYLIMKNENSLIGLFQGMFEGNIITFNPGWNENGQNVNHYMDIRQIQKKLLLNGVDIPDLIDTNSTGPASLIITDPDGNTILLDQHR